MPIFAIETSTERLSLAIIDGERNFAREIDAGQRHSELAIAAIADLFAEAKIAIAAIASSEWRCPASISRAKFRLPSMMASESLSVDVSIANIGMC